MWGCGGDGDTPWVCWGQGGVKRKVIDMGDRVGVIEVVCVLMEMHVTLHNNHVTLNKHATPHNTHTNPLTPTPQDLIDEHVQESLAKQYMDVQNDPQAALPHYMAVLKHPSTSIDVQTQHMTKFLEAVLQSEESTVCVYILFYFCVIVCQLCVDCLSIVCRVCVEYVCV